MEINSIFVFVPKGLLDLLLILILSQELLGNGMKQRQLENLRKLNSMLHIFMNYLIFHDSILYVFIRNLLYTIFILNTCFRVAVAELI